MAVELSDIIAESFYDVHWSLKTEQHTHYWKKGGRGSTKSSESSIQIIKGMMQDPDANAIVLRKVRDTLRESVYDQLLWAIDILGVADLWSWTVSPMQMKYLPTGQSIRFRGVDYARKIKSIKFRRGYAKYLWYEEVTEFDGMHEIRTINQSLMRGGPKFVVFYTYNPPESQRNWVNLAIAEQGKRPDTLIHHSTYLSVPIVWLGEQFVIEANHLKQTNPKKYAHEYLGEVIGTGAEVFNNVKTRAITDEEIARFEHIKRGMDFGFATDPLHYIVGHFDKTRRKLYLFHEVRGVGMSNAKTAREIKKENKSNRPITGDSAEPRTISELNNLGLQILPAKKGPDSVEHGVKFLQDLDEIIIDPIRCPMTAREFLEYEHEKDKDGVFKASYPDKNNHSIDAVRYLMEQDMLQSGVYILG